MRFSTHQSFRYGGGGNLRTELFRYRWAPSSESASPGLPLSASHCLVDLPSGHRVSVGNLQGFQYTQRSANQEKMDMQATINHPSRMIPFRKKVHSMQRLKEMTT